MEIRFLSVDEFHLLDQLKEEEKQRISDYGAIVAAAIEDGKIKGHLMILMTPHIECAYLDPDIRGGIIGARLEALLTKRLKDLGANLAIAFAVNDKMESYLKRLGYTQLATAWQKEL